MAGANASLNLPSPKIDQKRVLWRKVQVKNAQLPVGQIWQGANTCLNLPFPKGWCRNMQFWRKAGIVLLCSGGVLLTWWFHKTANRIGQDPMAWELAKVRRKHAWDNGGFWPLCQNRLHLRVWYCWLLIPGRIEKTLMQTHFWAYSNIATPLWLLHTE